jgi:HAE1 family hydrophobic/amphiphilic exporter-1
MIPLTAIATGVDQVGPSKILRQDRARVIQIFANIAPGGAVGTAISRTKQIVEKEVPLPQGVSYSFIGQADAFQDMIRNILTAFVLSLIFIYLVLASLYESFITPVTILLALPPAMSGAFFALFITGKMMDMNCMIGVVMLLGLVTKNSILLVDFALEGVRGGLTRKEAIARAGRIRLRPILMTTFAMIAATIPVAFGIGEAAKYRVSMGVAIIGGLVVSTLITLFVVPAVFEYIDRFREAVESRFRPEPEKGAAEHEPVSEIVEDLLEEKRKTASAKSRRLGRK